MSEKSAAALADQWERQAIEERTRAKPLTDDPILLVRVEERARMCRKHAEQLRALLKREEA